MRWSLFLLYIWQVLNKSNIAGIDYGSKLAGTTSVCFFHEDKLHFESSRRGQDADDMLRYFLGGSQIKSVFIDAPLSLPGVYFDNEKFSDFFYRECDIIVGAMSPMILGNLTARAMKLSASMVHNIAFYETHPARLAKAIHLQEMGYKGEFVYINKCFYEIKKHFEINISRKPNSWHELDALLCWISAYRHLTDEVSVYGDQVEGLIYV